MRSLELWREGLQKLPDGDGRRELASRRVADLERRVPTLVLQGASADDRLFVDGRAARAGEPNAVDPGPHTVTVTPASGSTRTLTVEAVEGRSTPVDVAEGSSAPLAPTSPPTSSDDGPSVVPAIVALSVGGAGLVAFGITGALWLGEKSTVDEECPGRVCSPRAWRRATAARPSAS